MVKDRKKWEEVNWRKQPVKFVCYKIQDHLPGGDKTGAKAGYLNEENTRGLYVGGDFVEIFQKSTTSARCNPDVVVGNN